MPAIYVLRRLLFWHVITCLEAAPALYVEHTLLFNVPLSHYLN
jgi:hypothetical protein